MKLHRPPPPPAPVHELMARVRAVANESVDGLLALRELETRGAGAVAAIVDALRDEARARSTARFAEALGRIGAPDALPALDALEAYSRGIDTVDGRFWSCMSLAKLGRHSTVFELIDAPAHLAHHAATALLEYEPGTYRWVERALSSPHAHVVAAMREALARASGVKREIAPEDLPLAIASAKTSPLAEVRARAAGLLGGRAVRARVGRVRDAIAALEACLVDPDAGVRQRAVWAVEQLGPKHAPPLRDALARLASGDPSDEVRHSASLVLELLDRRAR